MISGTATLGPDIRRGIAELDGKGEVVGGIVIMRFGENAEKVIQRVREKITEIEPTLPPGVQIVTTYDRADLIERSLENLKGTLIEELIIVSIVIIIFLWHIPERADSDRDDSHRHSSFVHPHAVAGTHREHHVARRYRRRNRCDGGRLGRRRSSRFTRSSSTGRRKGGPPITER